MKRVLFDMTETCGWGDRSWVTGHMAWYAKQGYEVNIKTGNWGQPNREDYDPTNPKKSGYRPEKPEGAKLYNPNREPVDYYINLVCPSLNANFKDLQSERSHNWKGGSYDEVVEIDNSRNPIHSFQNEKNVSQFEYKMHKNLIDENYKNVEKELKKKKNIVLCAVWDENNIYELWENRTKGLFIQSEGYDEEKYNTVGMWDDILNVVKKIDDFCLENDEYRIVLYSKKAQDWSTFLKSKFYDFRNFEDSEISLSQSVHLLSQFTSATMSYTTSPQIWLNYSNKQNHIVWHPKYEYDGMTLTGVVNNLDYFMKNPKSITKNQIKKLFKEKM